MNTDLALDLLLPAPADLSGAAPAEHAAQDAGAENVAADSFPALCASLLPMPGIPAELMALAAPASRPSTLSIGNTPDPRASAPASLRGGSAPAVDGILAQLAWSTPPALAVQPQTTPPFTGIDLKLPANSLSADAPAPEPRADLEPLRMAPMPPDHPTATPADLPAPTPEGAGQDPGASPRAVTLPTLAAAAAPDAAAVVSPSAPVAPPSPPALQAIAAPAPSPAALAEAADALPQQVLWQIGQGRQEARIQLRPRELGNVEVQIRIDGDRAHLVFSVEQPQARAVVQAALPLLAQQFATQGLQLGNTEVRADVQSDPRPPPFAPPRPGTEAATEDAPVMLAPARLRVGLFDQYA